jgi:hypothetical protein
VPQVILSNGQSYHVTSAPSPTYVEGNVMVIGNNDFTYGTSTSSSSCETNILKEEVCDRWRPNDESTSPRSSTLYATSHVSLMAKKEKNVASESASDSESESEDESDDEIDQHLAHLSKKDNLMVLKFIEKIDEQEEELHKQDKFVIKKIKCLEKLTKEHEKLKCSHASLVKRYENLSIE